MTKRTVVSTLIMASITAGFAYYYFEYHLPQIEKEKQEIQLKELALQKAEGKRLALKKMPINMAKYKNHKNKKFVLSSKKMINLDKINQNVDLNELEEINFSNSDYGNFFEGLGKENGLKTIIVKGFLKDQSKDAVAKKLKQKNRKPIDIYFLQGKTSMNSIELENINNLSGLNNLVEVKTITLRNLDTYNLDGLSSLRKVDNINISSEKLRDISNLSALTAGAAELDINLDKIEKPLDKNSYLCQTLNVFVMGQEGEFTRATGAKYNKVCEDSGFIEFDGEKKIKIKSNNSLSFLKNNKDIEFGSYETVKIISGEIKNIENMSNFIKLKHLELDAKKIKDVKFLDSIVGLETLILKNVTIGLSESVPDLSQLKSLTIENVKNSKALFNKISLKNNIESLKIINSSLEAIPVSLKKLKVIEISGTNFNDCTHLSKSANLQEVTFKNTHIRSLSGLEGLENISSVKLEGNTKLSDISALNGLKLKEISIDNKNLLIKISKDSYICESFPEYCEEK